MPNPFDLERLALGELPAEKKAELDARRGDPDVARPLSDIARSNEDILRAYPPERMAKQIRARMQPKQRRWIMVASAATAMMVVFVASLALREEQPEERTKGLAPQLHVWRKTAQEPQALSEGAKVKMGDVLQLGYVAAGSRYGVIASLDGRGNVTLHLPARETAEPKLGKHAGTIVLDTAYELDDAPKFERFFLITSDEKLETQAVLGAIKELANTPDSGKTTAPQLRGKIRVVSLRVDKEGS